LAAYHYAKLTVAYAIIRITISYCYILVNFYMVAQKVSLIIIATKSYSRRYRVCWVCYPHVK